MVRLPRTSSGYTFGIGASEKPPSQWLWMDLRPPSGPQKLSRACLAVTVAVRNLDDRQLRRAYRRRLHDRQ
jgi:hypothetical protein